MKDILQTLIGQSIGVTTVRGYWLKGALTDVYEDALLLEDGPKCMIVSFDAIETIEA